MNLELLRRMGKWLKQAFPIERLMVFGSLVSQTKQPEDVDLLVIMETQLKPYQQAGLIRQALDEKFGVIFPMDIIVRTPQQIEERCKLGDFFIKSILAEGINL